MSVLIVMAGFVAVVLVWTAALARREQVARLARFHVIADRMVELRARPQHALIETADVVRATPPVLARRRRVVCPAQPYPPTATTAGHTTSTPRHARTAS